LFAENLSLPFQILEQLVLQTQKKTDFFSGVEVFLSNVGLCILHQRYHFASAKFLAYASLLRYYTKALPYSGQDTL